MTDMVFYLLATLVVSAALSAVTIKSPKGAVFAFSLFCLALGGMFYWLSIISLTVALGVIGMIALVIYQKKFKRSGERADDKVSMLTSPNQTVAVFVLLCFLMTVTPVWIYSIWSSHTGEAPASIDIALLEKLGAHYFPALIGCLALLSMVALFAFQVRRSKVSILESSSVVEKERQG